MKFLDTRYQILDTRKGQTIVEAIVAISVLIAGFLGIFTLLASSLRANRIIADNVLATYLAAEGIEVVKNILDHNAIAGASWSSGFSTGDFEVDWSSIALSAYAGRSLYFNPITNLYGYEESGAPTPFQRRVRITLVDSDEIAVNSVVSWTSGLAKSSVNLEDHFLNFRP